MNTKICIHSLSACQDCKEASVCKKIPTTAKDLKAHVDASSILGKIMGEKTDDLQVVFATADATSKKNPDGKSPCLFRKSFYVLIKNVQWMKPEWFNDRYIAFLHIV